MDKDNDNNNEECNYTIHGNTKDSFDRCSYFLKVMQEDFAQKLSIPAAFVPNIRNEASKIMVLQGPSAQQWAVKLWGNTTQLEFRQGWENFVHHQAIESGDFLVFKYVCKSYFKVRIFGRNGCEKNTVISSDSSHKRCRDTATVTRSPIASHSEEELSDHAQAVAGIEKKLKLSFEGHLPKHSGHCQPSLSGKKQETVTSAETEQKSNGKLKPCYASNCMLPATEAKSDKPFKDANSFTSNKPFCLVVMKRFHVYTGFSLNFPKTYEGRLKLPKETREVILVDPNRNEWPVRYIWSSTKGTGSLSAGWKIFTVNNNLEEGDTCVFERVDKSKNSIKLRVHIFKGAKRCAPYKRTKDEIMEDSPAGRRRSPRFSKRCSLVKPRKKEQLCAASSLDGEESIDKDTVTTSPHDMNFEQEDLMIISDSSDESHAMAPTSGPLNLSPKPIPEEPLKTNSTFPATNPEAKASILAAVIVSGRNHFSS